MEVCTSNSKLYDCNLNIDIVFLCLSRNTHLVARNVIVSTRALLAELGRAKDVQSQRQGMSHSTFDV